MRFIRGDVGMSLNKSGSGVSRMEIQVSSTNASNVRLLVIVPAGSWRAVPGMFVLLTALRIVSIVRVQMIGDAPLPWPHPNRGLEGVDS